MTHVHRRDFGKTALQSLLTFSLLETLYTHDAFANDIRPVTADWLKSLDSLGTDLKGDKIPQTLWQEKVEQLFERVELPELLKFVDFEELARKVQFRERGERSLRPKFPSVEGLPTELVFGTQIFALKQGRSVVPHGHDNMATAFLVLTGDFHGRHYDRLEDEEKHLIVRPTIDEHFAAGGYSTVSDDKDNVHWFKATSATGFIFNIHVMNVEPNRKSGRVYVDPDGERLDGGRIRARRLTSSEAYKLYG